jgi:HEPN domain-containing protein
VDSRDLLTLTDADFDAVMMELHAKVRQANESVFGREIMILAEYTRHFHISLSNTDPTTKRIFEWCDRMYGDRLKGNFENGYSMVLVKGDTCKLHNWLVVGMHAVVCESKPIGQNAKCTSPFGRIGMYNLLEGWIDGVTPALAVRVSEDERKEILRVYSIMSAAFDGLDNVRAVQGQGQGQANSPYIKEATDDLKVSVDSCLQKNPNYGQSKWASLQAVEKMIKSCIGKFGGTVKFRHDLSQQCANLTAASGVMVEGRLVTAIQCKAEVRYDSKLVDKAGAFAAHYAALEVCGVLAQVLVK